MLKNITHPSPSRARAPRVSPARSARARVMRIPSHPRIRAQAPYGANPSARSALVCDVSNAPATTRACANTRDRSCRAHLDPALDVHNGRHRRRVVSCSAATTRVACAGDERPARPHVAYWVGGDKTRFYDTKVAYWRCACAHHACAMGRCHTHTHAHTHTHTHIMTRTWA